MNRNTKKHWRPFSTSAGVHCRGYSTRLQRVLTDFGADESFDKAAKKVQEHYGIDVPASTTRLKVEEHAKRMKTMNENNTFKSPSKMSDQIIGEADGGMVPIVVNQPMTEVSDVKIDRRKNKKLIWREGLLSLAREHKTVQPYFYASMGSRNDVGKQMAQCAKLAGRHEKTRLHCLGDGATWVAENVENEFGSDANFLIDFYHLTQYLAKAAQCCNPDDPAAWLEDQKKLMLENHNEKVFQSLQEHMNSRDQDHQECFAEKCFNYMDKRRRYLNYKDALDAELPIGSGEIESGIRSIIQSRIKLPGAWWLEDNVDAMFALKTVRANGFFDQYWNSQQNGGQGNLAQT